MLKTWRAGAGQPTAQPIAHKAPVRTVGPGCGRAVGWLWPGLVDEL